MPYVSMGDTDTSRSRRGIGLGIGTGATAVCTRGAGIGLVASASPKDDAKEGGGTEGYVSSKARGSVPSGWPAESEEAGVVIFVALLVEPVGGENRCGEDNETDVDGGVTDGLSAARLDGLCICDGGRGIGTLAETLLK